MAEFNDAKTCWQAIPDMLQKALENPADQKPDFIALECLANDPAYAKPDTEKKLLLWKCQKIEEVKISYPDNLKDKHPWLYDCFIGENFVRIPYNYADEQPLSCFNLGDLASNLLPEGWENEILELPRFSTASRSNFVLIPEKVDALKPAEAGPYHNQRGKEVTYGDRDLAYVNLTEWSDFQNIVTEQAGLPKRSHQILTHLDQSISQQGIYYKSNSFRLYSLKTGVAYVGSTYEKKFNKDRLEANSRLAMQRSKIIDELPVDDDSFDIQTEILTITIPVADNHGGGRDGFQVRDLSCFKKDLTYLPAQSIPYILANDKLRERFKFPEKGNTARQLEFLTNHFSIPVGRAKACLFLKYGLIHTSANAQNFILGLDYTGGSPTLKHFIARDIGDTSWHDTYIDTYRSSGAAQPISNALIEEISDPYGQRLTFSSHAPGIVRLAAHSIATHGFDAMLIEQCGWSRMQVYQLATGVLTGFYHYLNEVLAFNKEKNYWDITQDGIEKVFPEDSKILPEGTRVSYPYSGGVERFQENLKDIQYQGETLRTPEELLALAGYVRANAERLLSNNSRGLQIALISLEEVYLCTAIENYLQLYQENAQQKLSTLDNAEFSIKVIP